jgi:hypothetical protein
MMGVSGRAMIEALIAAERDPWVLADLAKGRLRVKHAALIDALTGRFDDHRSELAALLLEQMTPSAHRSNTSMPASNSSSPTSPPPRRHGRAAVSTATPRALHSMRWIAWTR